jgi:hypothetical protein
LKSCSDESEFELELSSISELKLLLYVFTISSVENLLAAPKSHNFAWKLSSIRIFSGLTSLWTMPCLCIYLRAFKISLIQCFTKSIERVLYVIIMSRMFPQLQRSDRKCSCVELFGHKLTLEGWVVIVPCHLTILGWQKISRKFDSLSINLVHPISSILVFSITLSAYNLPSNLHLMTKTSENLPFPINCFCGKKSEIDNVWSLKSHNWFSVICSVFAIESIKFAP